MNDEDRTLCPLCNTYVRKRSRPPGRVWHRDPLRRRKWCTGSPKYIPQGIKMKPEGLSVVVDLASAEKPA